MEVMLNKTFDSLANSIKDCFFVEVGANDGINFDPLYHLIKSNNWAGILVEPDKTTYERLKGNYSKQKNLIFENCAISDTDGKVELYCGTTDLHYSLSYKHAEWMFDVKPRGVEVESIRLDTLLNKHEVEKVDLLMIDVEGYDFIVLKTFPFSKIKPKIIRLEVVHISAEGNSTGDVINYLTELGYSCYFDEHRTDVIGILK